MIILRQMIVFFLIMLIGYVLMRKDILDSGTCKRISWIVVNVSNPALIVSGSFDSGNIRVEDLLQMMLIALGMYLVLMVLAGILVRVLRIEPEKEASYRMLTIFANVGFMGIPLISAMYGSKALLYGSMFLIPYNVLIYTYGAHLVSGKRRKTSGMSGKGKEICNIGVISCVMAVLIYVFQLPLPEYLTNTIQMLSNLTAPLSMMVIGASLAGLSAKSILEDKKLLLFSMLRLLIIPMLGICLIRLLLRADTMLGICLIMLAAPAGSMNVMLAQQYDGDVQTASKGVALTTVLSVVTIPAVFLFAGL